VQGVLEEAFSTILRDKIEIVGCGRTDAGVHAEQYVFHFDTDVMTPENLLYKLNRYLPQDIALQSMSEVGEDRHARFSATSRSYKYYLTMVKDPFRTETAMYYPYPDPPDWDLMNKAGKLLCHYKEFKPFCKVGSDTPHYLCDMTRAHWEYTDTDAVFTITANRFLRGMVRLIVGTMLQIGRGQMSLEELQETMSSQRPLEKPESVSPNGLHLVSIEY
jgi:tRNA pseudouridine38-40 synthase